MTLSQKMRRANSKALLYLKRSSPTLLCCLAALGVVGTAIAAAMATPKAMDRLDEAEDENGKLDILEKVIVVSPAYIPTVAIGVGTIICIFGANVLNRKQQATLLSAYKLAESSFKEYKSKVIDLYGEETHQKIVDTIVKEKAEKVSLSGGCLCSECSLEVDDSQEMVRTFYDTWSDRYFESTLDRVLQAEYHINRNFSLGGLCLLNDFYNFLGIKQTGYGNTVAWSIDDDMYWIDFNHRTITLDDGMEVIMIDAVTSPSSEFLEEGMMSFRYPK